MAEIERTRERERGTIPQTPYEIFIRSRKEFLERQDSGQVALTKCVRCTKTAGFCPERHLLCPAPPHSRWRKQVRAFCAG